MDKVQKSPWMKNIVDILTVILRGLDSPIQLALQILRPYGLIQLPIDNRYLSGAIFVRDGKRIPLINTALPRANQYFTAWHEIYHLLFDEVSFDHLKC